MKKIFIIFFLLPFIIFISCSKSDSTTTFNIEEEQVVYILIDEEYNSTEMTYEILLFEGYIPDLNKQIEGKSYKIFSYEFTTFYRYFNAQSYVEFNDCCWSTEQNDNINDDFNSNEKIPVEVTTNIGSVSGEVNKVGTYITNVQYNDSDPAGIHLPKGSDVNISWEYSSNSPECVFIYIEYQVWLDEGSKNYNNIKLVEKIIEGDSVNYLLNGDLLTKDGRIRIEIIPVNGAFVASEDENIMKEFNMSGDGIGYLYIFGERYAHNKAIGTYAMSLDETKINSISNDTKNKFIKIIENKENKY